MPLSIVFDDGCRTLGPLTDLRASFEVRTGARTTLERLDALLTVMCDAPVAGVMAPDSIAPLVAERAPRVNPGPDDIDTSDVFFINGRAALLPGQIDSLKVGEALLAPGSETLVAARMAGPEAEAFMSTATLPRGARSRRCEERTTIERPWDVIRFRDRALDLDLAVITREPTQDLPAGVIGIEPDSIWIHPGAIVYPTAVLDAQNGPIAIDDGATVRPGAIISGPAYIGTDSTVLPHAIVNAGTSIGPVCKVAGEIGGCVFQAYANKAHDGHLGDAWVGEWVNLGAGTTNSNLLNTYSEVASAHASGAPREPTGLTFYGGVIGDHTKTAICTRLMTGSCIGTGSMIATSASCPTQVDRFAWITDERIQRYRLNKFIDVARTVMARRDITPSEAYINRLGELYRLEEARA